MTIFKPTKAMIRARFILQRNCPSNILKDLKITDTGVERYFAPFPLATVKKWFDKDRRVWGWMLTPMEYEPKFLEAKELALSFYVSVLKLPLIDAETGVIDKAILNAKLKVAERLVGSDKDKAVQVNVTQNTQTLNSGTPINLPAHLRKNPQILEGKINQLREARLNAEEGLIEIEGSTQHGVPN